jgi:hypothetical protein
MDIGLYLDLLMMSEHKLCAGQEKGPMSKVRWAVISRDVADDPDFCAVYPWTASIAFYLPT